MWKGSETMTHPIRLLNKRRRKAQRRVLGWTIGPGRWKGKFRRVMQKEVRRMKRHQQVLDAMVAHFMDIHDVAAKAAEAVVTGRALVAREEGDEIAVEVVDIYDI